MFVNRNFYHKFLSSKIPIDYLKKLEIYRNNLSNLPQIEGMNYLDSIKSELELIPKDVENKGISNFDFNYKDLFFFLLKNFVDKSLIENTAILVENFIGLYEEVIVRLNKNLKVKNIALKDFCKNNGLDILDFNNIINNIEDLEIFNKNIDS